MKYYIYVTSEKGHRREYATTPETVHTNDWQKIVTEAVDDMERSRKEALPF